MKDITKFSQINGTPSDLYNVIDSPGSSIDVIFAEAIIANKPTSLLEEANIITVRTAPQDTDKIMFPIVKNKQFTWYDLNPRGGGSYAGSDISASTVDQVIYKPVQPTVKSASIFLPDSIPLANKVNFDLYAKLGATESQRKKEQDALQLLGSVATHSTFYAAGGFTETGSCDSGSTLDPLDLLKAKRTLSTGSNIFPPDFALMHPNTYIALNTHADFAPGTTSPGAMMRKAQFDENGDIKKFDGMDIYVTELIRSVGSASLSADADDSRFTSLSHPVVLGTKGKTIGRGEHEGIKVYQEDSRLRHGKSVIFDVSYDHTLLVDQAVILIIAAD